MRCECLLGVEDVDAPQQKPRSDTWHGVRRDIPVHGKMRAAILAMVPVFILGGGVSRTAAAPDAEISEFTVKAAYLSKFGGFVRWPDSAFASDTSPITICTLGDNPVGGALAKAAIRPIGSRPVAIRTIKAFSPESGCHIVYAGDSNAERVAQSLKAARGAGVLTVTDLVNSDAAASVINFVVKDNRVKFEIDERAAAENGLTISSQLLGLAVSVKNRG